MMTVTSLSRNTSRIDEADTGNEFAGASSMFHWPRREVKSERDTQTAEAVHDFRNILNTVSMLSEMARLDLPEASSVLESMRQIRAACTDASDLCNRMLDDSRNESPCVERADLNAVILKMAPLLTACVPAVSTLSIDLATRQLGVNISPCGIQQIVMNLVKNAVEALGNSPGTVTVSTGVAELDDIETRRTANRGSGKSEIYSFLDVSDNGCGMDEDTTARMFTGSFTTKSDGHGLGTASIRRIVGGCGAAVQVQSQVGYGTQIRVLFPQHDRGI